MKGAKQLDLWAYGVRNEYDDSSWDPKDAAAIDELELKARELHLGCVEVAAEWHVREGGQWVLCDDWSSADLEAMHRSGQERGSAVLPGVANVVERPVSLVGPDANVRRVASACMQRSFLLPMDDLEREALRVEVQTGSAALAERFRAEDKPELREACEKLGAGILPPLDRRVRQYMEMTDRERAAKMPDGAALAEKLWAKVDMLLYGSAEASVGSRGLQVLARSLPDDKLKLVKRYMAKGEVVGVTGDGTNDAPALRQASIGLAMGSGTDVAKDAAEITITNDNFASIVRAIIWGRNIFDNIRKFLQFQLTVNAAALLLTFIMACKEDGRDKVKDALPLNAVMLLWVNLIMDSMGALALATERPSDSLLHRPPHAKERLLSLGMGRTILSQTLLQLAILLVLSTDNAAAGYVCDCDTGGSEMSTRQKTTVFNAFVFCQVFNEINCRTIKELNVLARFFDSLWFCGVLLATVALQCFLVEVGGKFAGTNGLGWRSWLLTIAIGSSALPWGFLSRLIPLEGLEAKYGQHADIVSEEPEASIGTRNTIADILMMRTRKRMLVPVLSGAEGWFTRGGKVAKRVSPGMVGKLVGHHISRIANPSHPGAEVIPGANPGNSSLVAPLLQTVGSTHEPSPIDSV
eukprot:TRINITY_DN14163_c0_g2_i13.p1 TRINITY_DN14163_c0_g2~~TRINITY_DN14163_c0_g2_i13.p1  ORF type:complete len:637 (+),score=143.04 TRINITY_DN14163_c0_g2_i13:183-2093(+)